MLVPVELNASYTSPIAPQSCRANPICSVPVPGGSRNNSRGCTACHASRHVCVASTPCDASNSQFINSCSIVLEELHRLHNVCSTGGHRGRQHHSTRLAAAAARSSAVHSEQQDEPLQHQSGVTVYTPQLEAAVPELPASHVPELLSPAPKASDLAATAAGHQTAAAYQQPARLSSSRGSSQPAVTKPPLFGSSSQSRQSSRLFHGPHREQQQQRQRQQQEGVALQRPAMLTSSALRQLLQQQIQSATNWQQLQQLITARRDCLTLKHLGLMVMQVAYLQVEAQKQRMQELQKQYRNQQQSSNSSTRTSSSSSRRLDHPPDDLLSGSLGEKASAAAAQLGPFLQQLAGAISGAIREDPGLARLMSTAADGSGSATAADAAGAAEVPQAGEKQAGANGMPGSASHSATRTPQVSSSSSSTGRSSRFRFAYSNPPDSLSGYLANVLWGYAKLNHLPDADQLLLWVEAFAAVCGAADEVSFSQVWWALGQLQFWPGEDILEVLAAELARRMSANALAGAAAGSVPQQQHSSSRGYNTSAQQKAAAVTAEHMIGSRALSNILWAFAALDYTPSTDVLDRVWAGSVLGLSCASPQALSNLIWAIASLELKPSTEWMAAWESAVSQGLQQQQQQQQQQWNGADLANIAWACGKFSSTAHLQALVPSVPLRLSVMRAGRSTAAAATPRELVCLAWGLTASGVAFTATFTDKLLTAVTAKKIHFKAREWSQLLLVCAKQGLTPRPMWQRCCHAVMASRLRFMTALDFATCLWGIAQLGVEPRQTWKERFFAESYGQLFFLTAANCCALVWALGKLHWRPPLEWQDRLFLETYTKLAGFTAAELTGTLHGLAALRLQPPVQWMHQATAAVVLAAPELGSQELTTCLWAFSRLRYRPPGPWLADLTARAAQLLPEAWKPQPQQQQQRPQVQSASGGTEAAGSPSAAAHAAVVCQVSSVEAAHLLRAQQQRDKEEASLRDKRQQLIQQVKQLDQQRQALKEKLELQQQRGMSPRHVQQHDVWLRQQQQQEQKLLQLRGDLDMLNQQVALANSKSSAEQRQVDVRRLGYHDVMIVVTALRQLRYKLNRGDELLHAARKLGLQVAVKRSKRKKSTASKAASGSQQERGSGKAGSGGHLAGDAPDKRNQKTFRRVGAAARKGSKQVAESVINVDDIDTFTPGGAAALETSSQFLGSSQPNYMVSAGLSKGLHVPPSTGRARRRRHGKRYGQRNQQQSS